MDCTKEDVRLLQVLLIQRAQRRAMRLSNAYQVYISCQTVSDAVFHQPFSTLMAPDNRYILHLVHRNHEWIGVILQAPKLA